MYKNTACKQSYHNLHDTDTTLLSRRCRLLATVSIYLVDNVLRCRILVDFLRLSELKASQQLMSLHVSFATTTCMSDVTLLAVTLPKRWMSDSWRRNASSFSQRFCHFYRQDAAKRLTVGIRFTHKPKIRFFAPQGRLVAPIQIKLCRTDGHLALRGSAKFDVSRPRGWECGPQNIKNFHFLVKSHPVGVTPLTNFQNV